MCPHLSRATKIYPRARSNMARKKRENSYTALCVRCPTSCKTLHRRRHASRRSRVHFFSRALWRSSYMPRCGAFVDRSWNSFGMRHIIWFFLCQLIYVIGPHSYLLILKLIELTRRAGGSSTQASADFYLNWFIGHDSVLLNFVSLDSAWEPKPWFCWLRYIYSSLLVHWFTEKKYLLGKKNSFQTTAPCSLCLTPRTTWPSNYNSFTNWLQRIKGVKKHI